MRRLVSDAAGYPSLLARESWRAWDRFFFTPADPSPLGIIRITFGLLMLWSLSLAGPDLRSYFGSDAWADPEAVREFLRYQAPWGWSFWLLVPDGLLVPFWAGCLVVLSLYTLGLGSRVTSWLAWAVVVSTNRRAPVTLFGFDQVLSTFALYVAVSGASGRSFSLDRRLALRRGRPDPLVPTVGANLGLRLIQVHLAIIYGMSGLAKLQGGVWWDGSAMETLLATPEFAEFDLTWLAAYPLLLHFLTHAGLWLELTYPVLVWVRVLRPLVLSATGLLHVGIAVTLGLTEFGLAMIAANLAFVVFRTSGRSAEGGGP